MSPPTLDDLPTPCAVVDLDVLERNTKVMGDRVAALGARLRPHVKTHKCVEAARLQTRGHFGGITVSTLAEARGFAAAGFRDLTYAVPIAPGRLDEAAEIARNVERLNLLLDHERTLGELETRARSLGVRYDVLLKVDCGYHRAGVDPASHDAVRLARRLAESPAVRFRGVLTHAGHSYSCPDAAAIRRVARAERESVTGFATKLRGEGIDVDDVSLGSTPTLAVADDLSGVTEARPGNYVFFDVFQATIGSCHLDDLAFSVLSTVIGRYDSDRRLVLDAGALALSKDQGARHVDVHAGFGRVMSVDGRAAPPVAVVSLSQEHGVARWSGDAARLEVGARVRIQPNHSCLAAAMHDRYHVVRGTEVVDEWKPIRGW